MEKYQLQLTSYAYQLVKDREAAYDILQEIWIDVYKRLQQHGNEWLLQTKLWGWLRKAVFHASLNYLKQQRRTIPLSMIGDGSWLLERRASQFEQPDLGAAREEVTRELIDAVENLPFHIRATVYLHYFKDLTLQEIADKSECSLNTIKSHIRRGKKYLRRELRAKGIQLSDLGLWIYGEYQDFGDLLLYDHVTVYPKTTEEALSLSAEFYNNYRESVIAEAS